MTSSSANTTGLLNGRPCQAAGKRSPDENFTTVLPLRGHYPFPPGFRQGGRLMGVQL